MKLASLRGLLLPFLLNLMLVGCSDLSLDLSQTLTIEMYGIADEPDEVTGDTSPISQTYVLAGVSLASEDGSETYVLYDGTNATEIEIANRTQIIYTKDITDYKDVTFSGYTVSFSAAVSGTSENSDAHAFSLSSTDKIYNESFTAEAGKNVVLYIKLKWRNTVSGETMTEPDFELSEETS